MAKEKQIFINLISVVALLLGACTTLSAVGEEMNYTNQISPSRMLLVLSAPSVGDPYYAPAFHRIVDFQIAYAKAIMGNDNVIVIVDAKTRPYYEGQLPKDVLLTADVYDIWMRDFTTVNPEFPIQFTYTWASMTERESKEVQNSFIAFADQYEINREPIDLLLDGGNIVDNYAGRVITTTRFMEDNELSYEEAKAALMELLGATEVAILEPDEEVLAHADGMVSWVDDDVLLVNDYSSEPAFRKIVMDELFYAFPDVVVIEVPVAYTENLPGEWEGFESACGVNLNAVLTYENLYVPTFGMAHDNDVLEIIRQNTTKNLISINAEGVCAMGGSVRCLTWQLEGENAEKLILAARADR